MIDTDTFIILKVISSSFYVIQRISKIIHQRSFERYVGSKQYAK